MTETPEEKGPPFQSKISHLEQEIELMRTQLAHLQKREQNEDKPNDETKLRRTDSEEFVVQWYRTQRQGGNPVNLPGMNNERPTTVPPSRPEKGKPRSPRRTRQNLWDIVRSSLVLGPRQPSGSLLKGKFYEPYAPGRFVAALRSRSRQSDRNSSESPRRSAVTRGTLSTGVIPSHTASIESSQSSQREHSVYDEKRSLTEVMTRLYVDVVDLFGSLEVAAVFVAITIGIIEARDVNRYIEDRLELGEMHVSRLTTDASLKSIKENPGGECERQLHEMLRTSPEMLSSLLPPIFLDVNQFEEGVMDVFHIKMSRRLSRRVFHVLDKHAGRVGRVELKLLAKWHPDGVPPPESCPTPRSKTPSGSVAGDRSLMGGSKANSRDGSESPLNRDGSRTESPLPGPGRIRGISRQWHHGSRTLGEAWENTAPSSGSRLSLHAEMDFRTSLRSSGCSPGWNPQTKMDLRRDGARSVPQPGFRFNPVHRQDLRQNESLADAPALHPVDISIIPSEEAAEKGRVTQQTPAPTSVDFTRRNSFPEASDNPTHVHGPHHQSGIKMPSTTSKQYRVPSATSLQASLMLSKKTLTPYSSRAAAVQTPLSTWAVGVQTSLTESRVASREPTKESSNSVHSDSSTQKLPSPKHIEGELMEPHRLSKASVSEQVFHSAARNVPVNLREQDPYSMHASTPRLSMPPRAFVKTGYGPAIGALTTPFVRRETPTQAMVPSMHRTPRGDMFQQPMLSARLHVPAQGSKTPGHPMIGADSHPLFSARMSGPNPNLFSARTSGPLRTNPMVRHPVRLQSNPLYGRR